MDVMMLQVKHKALFALLCHALGNSETVRLSEKVEWMELCVLSIRQGVGYLILDALKGQEVPREVLKQWMGNCLNQEFAYSQYVKCLSSLNAYLRQKGLEVMVLKGYDYSMNWPRPEHRPIGDIDIFSPLFSSVDEVIGKDLGIRVKDDSHHSVFTYDGQTIENHRTILTNFSHKANVGLESLLVDLAKVESRTVMLEGVELKLPSIRFSAIYLLRHMSMHFPKGELLLRHVVDWATFVKSAGDGLDWGYVRKICRDYDMDSFLDVMNDICVSCLGYPQAMFPVEQSRPDLRDRVLACILQAGVANSSYRSNDDLSSLSLCSSRLSFFWKNRWKYKLVYNEGAISAFWALTRGSVSLRKMMCPFMSS